MFIALARRYVTPWLILGLLHNTAYAAEDSPAIVVSIKPLYALVAGVTQGITTPTLLVSGNQSPHDFQLTPSQMTALHHAKVVFYIDPSYETFLTNTLETLPDSVQQQPLSQSKNITLLPLRSGGVWEEDEHDHHDQHDAPLHPEHDMHVWLDPDNAIAMTHAIAATLSHAYPAHQAHFERNATTQSERIHALDTRLKKQLEPFKNKSYIVFHDAYQYAEKHYQLQGVGSITFEPEESPSPARLLAIRDKIKQSGAGCVFTEPFVSDKIIQTISEGIPLHHATLDPEATALAPDIQLYDTLMQQLADNLTTCLKG